MKTNSLDPAKVSSLVFSCFDTNDPGSLSVIILTLHCELWEIVEMVAFVVMFLSDNLTL